MSDQIEPQEIPSSNESQEEETDGQSDTSDFKKVFFKSMLKQVRAGTPIYRCQLPIFIMEPRSLLDKLTDFFCALPLVSNITRLENPEERFLTILSFFFSSWHHGPKGVKAPFNPILGEVFRCSFRDGDTTAMYVAEQISHHPPSSAFILFNREKNLCLQAYLKPTSKFCGNSIETCINGTLVGHLLDLDEVFELTYPKYVAKGIFFGTLKLELGGKSTIRCEKLGLMAEVEFKPKCAVSGKVHRMHKSETLYHIHGSWDSKVMIINAKTKKETVLMDIEALPQSEKIVTPLEEQQPFESHKVWHPVASNIMAKKELEALSAKTAIEEHQRQLAREHKVKNANPKFFSKLGETWVYSDLKRVFGREVSPIVHQDGKHSCKSHNAAANLTHEA